MSINPAAVRKLAMPDVRQRVLEEARGYADAQRMTVRCEECGWFMHNILVADGKRAFTRHLDGKRHRDRNRKRGSMQKTRDKHAGYSWVKR